MCTKHIRQNRRYTENASGTADVYKIFVGIPNARDLSEELGH
jgi:hypothetical protein